jgi:glycosyltransferase involved in cell wall biosynthesis
MAKLSIIIPASHEQYLQNTIYDIIEHAEGDYEILVALDNWEDAPQIITIGVIVKTKLGQRGAMNKLVSIATGDFVMKVDAHCSFSQGFDIEMMKAMDDKTIMSPYMLKLDAENWTVLPQHPTSMYVFDTDLVMQHWREGATQDLIEETMCPSGAAFIVTRENYWKWNLCDESLGSWGGQVTELGIKAYLNGGRCITNKNAFFGHLFREKKEDFPYERGEHPGQFALEELRKRYKNKSIAGLIEKFNYPANWTKELVDNLPE